MNLFRSEYRRVLDRSEFLVLDDNRNMRVLLRNILHGFGVRTVYEAVDAVEALEILKETSVSVGIFDHELGGLSGVELAQIVRTSGDSPAPKLPIIMCTAHTEHSTIMSAMEAGVDEVLAKPVSANEVGMKVEAVLFHRRPFVNTKHYFGPCRRREAVGRAGSGKAKAAVHEQSVVAGPGRF